MNWEACRTKMLWPVLRHCLSNVKQDANHSVATFYYLVASTRSEEWIVKKCHGDITAVKGNRDSN
jgi:hypothetical protein